MPDPPKRNDPCPCGSGAKYKRCCGRPRSTFTEDDRLRALESLELWSERDDIQADLDLASILFWGDERSRLRREDFEVLARSPAVMVNFLRFFQADLHIEDDRRLIDLYLQDRGPTVLPGERSFLEALRTSHLGIYELVEERGADEVLLRDLIADQGDQWVRVALPERDLGELGSVLVARVMPDSAGALTLRDDVYSFAPGRKPWLLGRLEDFLAETPYSEVRDPEFLKLASARFNSLWLEAQL